MYTVIRHAMCRATVANEACTAGARGYKAAKPFAKYEIKTA